MSHCFYGLRRFVRAATFSLCALSLLCGVIQTANAQIIDTVVGTTSIAGRPARSISVQPAGMATTPDGAVYVADQGHSQILRFDPIANSFSVVAGTAVPGNSGDGGPAINAQLSYPSAVAVDAAGNLVIADVGNNRIRKVDAVSGTISTIAGGGTSTDEGVLATGALLQGPRSITISVDGSIYIVEQDISRIRRVDPATGLIVTIAGTGTFGSSGDGGPAILAQLAHPTDVAFDAQGNLYIADQYNHCVRVVDAATGIIRKFAGSGQQPSFEADGYPAIDTPLSTPTALRFDAQGNLFVTQLYTADQYYGRVRKIDAATTIVSTVAGGGTEFEGVPATSGRLNTPQGLALATNGDIYVSSQDGYLIQRISGTTGMLEVVAGNSSPNYSGDGAAALLAQASPALTVVNAASDIFFLDGWRIRKVEASTGTISTYAGTGASGAFGEGGPAINAFIFFPTALTIDSIGNLFVSDQGNHRIRKINAATGIISHYAGIGTGNISNGDGGPAINAQMRQIRDIATDASGNLYVIEVGGLKIRKINAATGIITSIAGNGSSSGPWGDGQLATNVSLYPMDAIALDRQANIYIVQKGRIRRISAATGIISTVAGTGGNLETGDGGPALAASINVGDLELDFAGNIFITSFSTQRVRRIDVVTKIITTVAGVGIAGYAGDGGPATTALLFEPRDLAFNSAGNLYIAERNRIRRITGIGATHAPGDATPPIINATVTGQLGNNGWYRGNVTVKWTVSDSESAIASSTGCATSSITADTIGLNLTCTATSEGGIATKTVTIKRDTTVPSMTFGVPNPAPNAAGWINTDAVVPFTITDAVSGVLGNTQSSAVESLEGVNVQYTVSAADNAGNSRAFTLPLLSIDKTPPTVAITTPANNTTYVIGSTLIASYACSDSLSGISTCLGSVPNGSALDTSTPGSYTFSVTVTDFAGNITTTTYNYSIGSTAGSTYCSSRGTLTSYEFIRSVQIGSSLNTSNNNGGYGDFTANPISVVRGANSMVLTPGYGGGTFFETWRVWIDLNHDGAFGANEALYASSGDAALTSNLNIPSTALSGPTRMRVAMSYQVEPTPCAEFGYGEVEDYSVIIP